MKMLSVKEVAAKLLASDYMGNGRDRARFVRSLFSNTASMHAQSAEETFVKLGLVASNAFPGAAEYRKTQAYTEWCLRWKKCLWGDQALRCKWCDALFSSYLPFSSYVECCSKACSIRQSYARDKDAIMKRKSATLQKNYGVDSPAQSEVIRKRVRRTVRAHYGVDNPMHSDQVKAKLRQTNLSRRGHAYPTQDPQVMKKQKTTNLARIGHASTFNCPKVREKIKATMVARFGVPNPQQNIRIRQKTIKSAYRRKEFVTTEGARLRLQGYEPQVAEYLEGKNCLVGGVTFGIPYETDRPRVYFGDLLVTTRSGVRHIVEVKSLYTAGLSGVAAKYKAAQRFSEQRGWGDHVLIVWLGRPEKPKVFKGRQGLSDLRDYLGK